MPEVFRERGVHYFAGRVRCPLAGAGRRGDFDSNRLVLDDDRSTVTIDRAAHRIVVRNEHAYARRSQKSIIADLSFGALGTTATGGRVPLTIHLKVMKRGEALSIDLHRHLRNQQPLTGADFEPFEVVVEDGRASHTLLDEARVRALVSRPSLALRVVKALMAMRDNLVGVTQDPARPGYRLADLSVGFGALGLSWMVARAELVSLSEHNEPLVAARDLARMLREGAWEMRLTAQSVRWLPEVVRRDLFLYGLDELPLLAPVRERGLLKGESLAFRFDGGRGSVRYGDGEAELPDAIDVARAYLEFHMLGGLFVEHAAGK
jgi:hypothetical protein